MKTVKNIVLILITLFSLVQCEKYDAVGEITEERFVFNEGDTLRYICTNGLVDTFYVSSYRFWESTGTWVSPAWFGGYTKTSYKIDRCEVLLMSINDSSKIHLGAQCDLTPWYKLSFKGEIDYETSSSLWSQCETDPVSKVQYPLLKMTDRIFNQHQFSDVYYLELLGQPYIIYWNLKYGIIRFEGINEATGIYWDLDDSLLGSQ